MHRQDLIEKAFEQLIELKRAINTRNSPKDGFPGLSPTQIDLMIQVKRAGSITAKELAASTELTPGAISQVLDPMVEADYINRQPNPDDRRMIQLSIGAKGKQCLDELFKKRRQMFAKVFGVMDDQELEQWLILQSKLTKQIKLMKEED